MARGKGNVRKRHSVKNKPKLKIKKPLGKKDRIRNGRDIKHRDQFKRPLTEDVTSKVPKRRKVEPVSDSEEEEDSYRQLLGTFASNDLKSKLSVESEEESGEESTEVITNDNDVCNLTSGTFKSNRDSGSESEEKNSDEESQALDLHNQEVSLNSKDDSESEEQDEDADGVEPSQDDVESDDPFHSHICCDLSDEAADIMSKPQLPIKQSEVRWKVLGRIIAGIPDLPKCSENSQAPCKVSLEEPKTYAKQGKVPDRLYEINWDHLHVKPQLQESVLKSNPETTDQDQTSQSLTPLQLEVFTILNNYQDLYLPERSLSNGEALRFTYCLHVVNHIIKTRNKVLHHNAKLNKKNCIDVPEDFRDQGLVRPKVLILVPFREQARRVVEMLIKLVIPEESKGNVMNKSRFDQEFSGQELIMPKKNPRPEDYEALFSGNTDDTFRLGITVTKKCLKLYADFYSSDIIISSPLGLRMIIGAEGESERDYDFLASIEILILDQADVFLMQNWDHLLHLMDHLHLQPRESHDTDFSRVRTWAINGLAKYYRQTILFSSMALPEFSALFNKRCRNYAGYLKVVNPISSGSICQVIVQLPQVFQQVEASSVSQALDSRFNYFIKKVLPEHLDPLMSHTVIYVPSYFDFVRIRNYLRKEGHSFVQICEYSKDAKVARARDMFYHSQVQFLLYSERFHFFRRPCIKGIRHIVFYQPPTIPHFYSEMCNHMQESNQHPHGGSESNMSVTVLYSRFDAQQLAAVVGSDRASKMINSDRNVHMFVTGE